MRSVELRSDTDRYVLFLENPTSVYRNQLEGSGRGRVDTQVNQFLDELTPESALQDAGKFPDPLRQLKSRGGNIRALGTWCQGESYDLFIIQALFNKKDEDQIYTYTNRFQRRGRSLQEKFNDLTSSEIEAKVGEWRDRDDLHLCTS